MTQNEITQQIIKTIRTDILSNSDFIRSIVSKIPITRDNFPNELILEIMNQVRASESVPRPISNKPKSGGLVSKPISITSGGVESKIVSDLLEGNNVYLMGKAGTGKTYLAKAIAESVLAQPVYVINCSQWTSPIEIKGGQTIKGYEEGQLIKAWATGGVLILDELPKLDPNTAGLLNDALAEAASQPKYTPDGNIIEDTIPTLTNGRGEIIYKGQNQSDNDLKFRFCVIGTGNTDMMNVGNKYAGNQRQDYSLVDRFAGSYYTIEQDTLKEKELTYSYVFGLCNSIRKFLISKDAIQSISLRTMLNFNRTYEQEMLFKIESRYADKIYTSLGDLVPPKSINDSIESFKSMLEKKMGEELEQYQEFRDALLDDKNSSEWFTYEFMVKYHKNPNTGDDMTSDEVEEYKERVKEDLKRN
jgi:cobaltochelatase CobS